MKIMKELNSLKDDVLDEKLRDFRTELMKFRSQIASGTVPRSPGRIKLIKKNIARIYTIKTQRGNTKE